CSACHGLGLVAFRNLSDKGGPEFSVAQVKELASTYKVQDGPNDKGEMFERPGRPADKLPTPFANAEAAKAAHGAVPPDLSLIAKARSYERGVLLSLVDLVSQYQEHGPDYLVALLTGYTDPPKGVTVEQGLHYNPYFAAGDKLAMASPLNPDQVEYTDGTKGTVQQYAKDVTAFLMWAAEPKMEERKRTGWFFMILMVLLAGFTYFTKKKIWSDVAH
ncbi:MAG TPA: cytochrome c1, partial [Beijerinckiaceae bacterium]|nr:cytochrome c1 [Beijerinckiaceae bacterium]